MNASTELFNVNVWQRTLGLLPIPLFGQSDSNRHILLNGSQGNFCLDTTNNESLDLEQSRAYAWSSNVGHYVTLIGNSVQVQRWDSSRFNIEKYTTTSVYDNLEKFHEFLQTTTPNQEMSIIAHSIRFFRRLRATLGSNFDGTEGLKLFLFFLASAADNNFQRNSLDLVKWNLTDETRQLAEQISNDNWESLLFDFLQGRKLEKLTPDLNLVIRHASGQIFQEAHYEALFMNPGQMMLSGFLPSPVKIAEKPLTVGSYFTPPSLARTLVEESLRHINLQHPHIKMFDPACGSGEFLREALRQLRISNYGGRATVIGWDISEAACDMAKFEIGWELRDINFQVDINIERRDSLDASNEWPVDVDFLLMNPPFVAWHSMDSDTQKSTVLALGSLSDKRPNMAFAFIIKASQSVKNMGILGTVIPSSFFDGVSANKLRKSLAKVFSPILVARLGSQHLFANATVDVGFYIAKSGQLDDDPLAFWADYRSDSSSAGLRALRKLRIEGNLSLPLLRENFSIYPYPEILHKTDDWSPRPYSSWKLLQSLDNLPRVKDIFDVKQGIKTGLHKAFVLSKDEFLALPKKEQKYFRPAIINESIRAGFVKDITYGFFPYGQYRFSSLTDLRKAVPQFYESYLLPNKDRLLSRARVDPERWWEYTYYRPWLVEPTPKIVSTQFGDVGSFGLDRSGIFIPIDAPSWLPLGEGKRNKFANKIGYAYLAILNSDIFSQLLAASSTHVSGGQWALTKQYIVNIALPDLFRFTTNSSVLQGLVKIGKCIFNGIPMNNKDVKLHAKLVKQAYGISNNL
jgi:adenine-specific DNA-methyltransferase